MPLLPTRMLTRRRPVPGCRERRRVILRSADPSSCLRTWMLGKRVKTVERLDRQEYAGVLRIILERDRYVGADPADKGLEEADDVLLSPQTRTGRGHDTG